MARGWNLQLLTYCLLLGFMGYPSVAIASRLPTAFQGSSHGDSTSKIFRAELIHRDHADSPLRPPSGTTSVERLTAAVARSKARATRRLGATTPSSEVHDLTPITPGGDEYLITIQLGTPAQKFVVIVDTGSDLVWVQCLPCNAPNACFPAPNPYFNTTATSSYSVVPCNGSLCDPNQFEDTSCVDDSSGNSICHVSYSYADGSFIQGDLSTDTLSLRNSITGVAGETPDFLFGCMNNDSGLFSAVDGLVGFGRGPNSLPSQLTQSTANNVFSYCLVPYTAATALTSALLLGVTSARASYFLPLVHTPILTNDETLYWVSMTGMSVNGMELDIPSSAFQYNASTGAGGVIFDSGTTLLILQEHIFATVVKSLQELISYPEVNSTDSGLSLCYNLTGVKHPSFPSMSLQFAGINGTEAAKFPLTPQNLFVPASADDGSVVECLAIASTGNDVSSMLIGNIAQANHYVEYDVTNLQLGWSTSVHCSQPLL